MMYLMDLSGFRAAPSARLSHFLFERVRLPGGGFSSLVLSVCGADYKGRMWMPLSMQEVFQIGLVPFTFRSLNSFMRPFVRMPRGFYCSAPRKLDHFDLEFLTAIFLAGRRSGSDESIQIHGRAEGVHCLALGGVDLTSSAGKMTMNVINAVAQFERDLLIERTQSGLARAKTEGKPLGRPSVLSADQQLDVKEKIKNGEAISAIVRQFQTSRQTILRVRAQA